MRRLFLHSVVVRTPLLQPAAEMTPDFETCRNCSHMRPWLVMKRPNPTWLSLPRRSCA